MERLDRACANLRWSSLFSKDSVSHIHVNCSDHKALLLRLDDKPEISFHSSRQWRFEAAWLHSDQCEQVVAKSWGRSLGTSPLSGLAVQIASCTESLKRWSKVVFGADKNRVRELETELKRLLGGRMYSKVHERCAQLRKELEQIAAHEETVWR
ncbi:UNVERIFIED_CONTAM: hypothetical protein Slati_1014900 [Sesamum latifolium]|uniref:Uncharacterized protein n=1 Tax=Sesamum latifolium TaxID=2727402 RepID=A0AAW2XRW9_9LAMI